MSIDRRPEGSFLYRRTSRRGFLKGVAENAVPAVVIVGTVGTLTHLVLNAEKGQGRLDEKLVQGESEQFCFTKAYGELDEIPVRSGAYPHLYDKNLKAWTKPGMLVFGKAVYGKTYSTREDYGNFAGPDGQRYGLWYELNGVVAYDKDQSGNLVPRYDTNTGRQLILDGVHIAATFIRPFTDEEYSVRFKATREEVVRSYKRGRG